MYLYLPKDLATRKVNRPIEPEMVLASLCYRGVHYCKWVMVNSIEIAYQKNTGKLPSESWKLDW
tara:strand:- start:4 stop:195 length:192 start_codon:yes stop_codon:yes gene_type:complete